MIFIEGPAIIYYGNSFCEEINDTYKSPANPASIDKKLGITESGVQISINNLTQPVHTDDMGGTEGFPAEIINMATTASIRGVLVDYAAGETGKTWQSVSRAMELGINNHGDSDATPLIGSSYFGDNYGFSLKIVGRSTSYVFPRCSLLESPREFNLSTGAKKTSFTFTAYPIFVYTIDGTTGVNQAQTAFLYRKIASGELFHGCHDAIGGFEHTVDADNNVHTQR